MKGLTGFKKTGLSLLAMCAVIESCSFVKTGIRVARLYQFKKVLRSNNFRIVNTIDADWQPLQAQVCIVGGVYGIVSLATENGRLGYLLLFEFSFEIVNKYSLDII